MKNLSQSVKRDLGLVAAIIALVVTFTIIEPIYFSTNNFIDILDQTVINGLIALGISFTIITGGIDLSVGSIFALVIVIVADLLVTGINPAISILFGIIIGFILGVINGFLVAKLKLQPFIATLGTMSVYRGIAYVYTGGWPILNIPANFRMLFNNRVVFNLPYSIFYLIIFAIVSQIILKYTKFGTYIYGIGGNEEATYLSGVNIDRTKILAYGMSGIGAALAGMVLLARLGSGEPATGQGYELNAIAAAAIGGISMAGGKGNMVGTLLGAILLTCLRVGLVVAGVDSFWQFIATGAIIVIAAYFEVLQTNFGRLKILRRQKQRG